MGIVISLLVTFWTGYLVVKKYKPQPVLFIAGVITSYSIHYTKSYDLGELIEVGDTEQIFTNPRHKLTQGYITGRFG